MYNGTTLFSQTETFQICISIDKCPCWMPNFEFRFIQKHTEKLKSPRRKLMKTDACSQTGFFQCPFVADAGFWWSRALFFRKALMYGVCEAFALRLTCLWFKASNISGEFNSDFMRWLGDTFKSSRLHLSNPIFYRRHWWWCIRRNNVLPLSLTFLLIKVQPWRSFDKTETFCFCC